MGASDPERIEETEIAKVVLAILADQPNGRATVKTIRSLLMRYVHLSEADQAGSLTRAREELWEQQVRNLKSHDMNSGNVFHDGLVRWVRRGVWELTEAGWKRVRQPLRTEHDSPA